MAKKGRFARLDALPAERLAELRLHLTRGVPARTLAEEIKRGWGLFAEVSHAALAKQLLRYKAVLAAEIATDVLKLRQRRGHETLPRIDVMAELVRLIGAQKARLAKIAQQEAGSPWLVGMVGVEMDRLKALVVDLARLQLETGILPRAPKLVNAALRVEDESNAAFSWTAEHDELIALALEELPYGEEQETGLDFLASGIAGMAAWRRSRRSARAGD